MISRFDQLAALLRRTPIRWLLLGYYLILLIVTLTSLSLGLRYMLGRFLWQSNEARLHSTAEAGWFLDNEEDSSPRRRGLNAPRGFPKGADELARRMAVRGVFVRILTPQGEVLAESGRLRNPPPVDLQQLALVPASKVKRGVSYLATSEREWQVLLLPVMGDDEMVGVVQMCGLNRASRELLGVLTVYLGLGGILALLLAIILSLVLTRILSYPLERLMLATRKVRQGDLSARTGLSEGSNEIYAVASAFDGMVGQLQDTFEAQRRFVADASHELKTPLTAIGGMAELLAVGGDQGRPEQREKALKTIEKEVDRMNALVSDLLTLSRAEQMSPTRLPLDLLPLLRDLVSRAAQLSPNAPRLVCPLSALQVRGDGEQLGRLVGNLIDNAIQYSPEDGSIEVRADREGDEIVIEVSDHGVGIDEKHLPHIFERFYRADDSRARKTGGSGLGLAIVRALAEQHGGKVTAHSRPGEGSTFTVRLPVSEGVK